VLLGKYADTQPQKYNATQPRDKRKKGFLSGDARKRDMAMNTTMGTIMGETFSKVCLPSFLLALRSHCPKAFLLANDLVHHPPS